MQFMFGQELQRFLTTVEIIKPMEALGSFGGRVASESEGHEFTSYSYNCEHKTKDDSPKQDL